LLPPEQAKLYRGADAKKISLAMRLAHKPGSVAGDTEPFAKHGVNLLKIESGRFTDGRGVSVLSGVGAEEPAHLEQR